MKVKILTSISGIDFSFAPGDETDRFDQAEVENLIAAGYAEAAEAAPVAQKAAAAPKRETATRAKAAEKRASA